MTNERKSEVKEEVKATLLANARVGNKNVTLELIEGTISEEGRDDITYTRYGGEIVSLDKEGKTLSNYIRGQDGKSYEVPVKKKFSFPKEVGEQVAQAILKGAK